jgi:hypothetical protein
MIKPCDAAWLCVAATWSAATPAAAAIVANPSNAADAVSRSVLETQIEADIDAVFAAGDLQALSDPPFIDARFRLNTEAVRQNGQRWGLRTGVAMTSGDGRRGFAQILEAGPTVNGQALTGLATGFAAAPGLDAGSGQITVSTAELYLTGRLFEWRVGVGATAARSSDIRPGAALRLVRADGALSDPAGGGLAHTALSLSAPAPRIAVQSRRLLGFSASASYTPEGERCGVEQCRPADTAAIASPDINDIVSIAVDFDRRSRTSAVRWRAHWGVERGEIETSIARFADPWIMTAELAREAGGLTLAVRALSSNDGFEDESYTAWSGLAALERGDWLYSLEYARGQSSAFAVNGASVSFGASRLVGTNALISFGYQAHEAGGDAMVAEIGLRF